MTAQQHTRDLDNFRDALSELRTGGGISEEFAQWHGQVMASLDVITSEFPIAATKAAAPARSGGRPRTTAGMGV